MQKLFILTVMICSVTFIAGCGGDGDKKTADKDKKAHNHDDHKDGDDHDHGDHIGANNPHKIEFKDAPFNALWGHAGDLVTITVTDNEYKKEMPISAKEIVVSDKGGKNKFNLKPVKAGDDGKCAEFELANEALELVMDEKPTVSITEGGKTYEAVVVHIH